MQNQIFKNIPSQQMEILNIFINKHEAHDFFKTPHFLNLSGINYVLATNRISVVRFKTNEFSKITNDGYISLAEKLEGFFQENQFNHIEYIGLPAVELEICSDCKGTKNSVSTQCTACGGSGESTPFLKTYICQKCDGQGETTVAGGNDGCKFCESTGFELRPLDCMHIGNAFFNVNLIHKLNQLPNVKIKPRGKESAYFIFDGGDGLVMPMEPPVFN